MYWKPHLGCTRAYSVILFLERRILTKENSSVPRQA